MIDMPQRWSCVRGGRTKGRADTPMTMGTLASGGLACLLLAAAASADAPSMVMHTGIAKHMGSLGKISGGSAACRMASARSAVSAWGTSDGGLAGNLPPGTLTLRGGKKAVVANAADDVVQAAILEQANGGEDDERPPLIWTTQDPNEYEPGKCCACAQSLLYEVVHVHECKLPGFWY